MTVILAIFGGGAPSFTYCAECITCITSFNFSITLWHKICSILQEKTEIHLANSWECSFKGLSDFKACAPFHCSVIGGSKWSVFEHLESEISNMVWTLWKLLPKRRNSKDRERRSLWVRPTHTWSSLCENIFILVPQLEDERAVSSVQSGNGKHWQIEKIISLIISEMYFSHWFSRLLYTFLFLLPITSHYAYFFFFL